MSELRLDGKVAVITGGAKGIGYGISHKLAQRGAKVVVNGNYRPSGAGEVVEVAEEIRALGGEATPVNGAVHDRKSAKRIVAKAIETYGRIDILVNNAGTAAGPNVPDGPDESFQEQVAVHICGSMLTVESAWPHMSRKAADRSSTSGQWPRSGSLQGWLGPVEYGLSHGQGGALWFDPADGRGRA